MATYSIANKPNFSYSEYLQINQYSGDLEKGIGKKTGKAIGVINNAILENANQISNAITNNSKIIASEIDKLSQDISFELQELNEGMRSLRADFDIAMGKVLLSFEMLRSELKTSFDEVINILENRRKFEAQEHMRDAIGYYTNGCKFLEKSQWFSDALKHFLQSVDLYANNPLAHFYIAHIYHYQNDLQDFEKALDHYRLAYTYAEADNQMYAIASQAYFYAGWLSAANFDNIDYAIDLTKNSIKFDTTNGEAFYNLSKFSSLKGKSDDAIKYLERAIVDFDRNYSLKAIIDLDFINLAEQINLLFESLRDKARDEFMKFELKYDPYFDPKDKKWSTIIAHGTSLIKTAYEENTYFAYLDALSIAPTFKQKFNEAIKAKSNIYDNTVRALTEVENFLNRNICLSPSTERKTNDSLRWAKSFIEKDDHELHKKAQKLISNFYNSIKKYSDDELRIERDRIFNDFLIDKSGKVVIKSSKSLKWIVQWIPRDEYDDLIQRVKHRTEDTTPKKSSRGKQSRNLCKVCGKQLNTIEKLSKRGIHKKCHKR